MIKSNKGKNQFAFSLIELMTVVLVLGVLGTTFVSMGPMVRDFRVGYVAKKINNAIMLARSEAITLGKNVSLCRSTSGTDCEPPPSLKEDWADGWIVFMDVNGNLKMDPTDKIIRIYNKISDSFKLKWDGSKHIKGFSYNKKGYPSFDTAQKFHICLKYVTDALVRTITLYGKKNGGRVEATAKLDDCGMK